MKKKSNKIITSTITFIVLLLTFVPHMSYAAILGFSIDNTLFQITAALSEFGIAIAGSLVTITGSLLNATMTATLNMSAIVNNTPSVGIAWTTIRDFGSVFIIFLLLDASIRMILGAGSGVGKLIKNIVIAGLLINFSLFFTKLAVDASNIVSLSFYSAIAPTSLGQTGTTVNSSNSAAGQLVGLVGHAFNDGGLGNVFMQSLDLQSFANSASSTSNSTASTAVNQQNMYWNITLANTGATILMIFAAISFLAAAAAFAVRIGVLIMLMAFSPIFFIAMIFPDLKQYSDKWYKMLYSMCIFMPVYLLLMYVAMSVLNDPHFFDFAKVAQSTTNISGGVAGSLIGPNTIGTVLQYIIAIFLINAPLMAAISIAGEGADFVKKMMSDISKWGQGAITGAQKRIQGTPGFVGQHTIGRAASAAVSTKGFKSFAANNPLLGTYAAKGLKGVAGASFGSTKGGFDKRTEKYSKDHQDVAKALELSDDQITREHYNTYDNKLRAEIDEAQKKADEIYASAGDLTKLSPDERDKIEKRQLEAQKKVDDLKKKLNRTDNQKKGDIKKVYQEEYARNLGADGINIVTRKARKDAMRKILSGLNRDKKEKLFDDLKKELAPEKEEKEEPKK